MTIENAQKDIIDNFLFFDDWTQKYEYIIELSKDLEFMSENLKNEDNEAMEKEVNNRVAKKQKLC